MQVPSWLESLNSPGGVARRLAARGPEIVVAVFSLAIAAEAALLLTHQAPGVPTAKSGAAARAANRLSPQAPSVDLGAITSAHLFGEASADAGDGNAPKTALQLVLTGVLASPDPEHGQAILGPAATSAKLYSTGSRIPGGARLKSVYNDRVLLENNGAVEALYLPRTAQGAAPVAPAATGGQRLQNVLQNTNNSLLNGLIRMQPSFDKGKLAGYRVFPGRNGATAFGQLGLKPSDLITAINGTALDDPNRANEILQTLSSADSAQLTVTRAGQTVDLSVNLSEVANAAEANGTAEPADDSGAESGPAAGPARFGGGRPGGPGRGPRNPNPPTTDQ
ncbi:MAG TPA: type II secretion system protein GspC [Steroidobacteraceae bacterium]|nr:type II secretion system protein GspC [Steroidobacteraceae bacterium]